MTWQQEGNGGSAVATIGFFLLEWWSTAGAAVLSERVGGVEIRQLERTDLHELPDSWVVWTEKKVQALRSEEKLRGRPFHAQSTPRERLDTSQARRHITGLPSSYNKSRRSCSLLVETIKHSRISTSRQALCRLLWSRGGHEADETRGERALSNLHTDVPASEASRKLLEQQLTELKTQQRAQQPLSKELESARGAMQRAQRREEEARGAFTLAQSVKEQADQEAAKLQSELCTLEQEAHNAATEASGTRPRPLLRHHGQYHLRMAPSRGTNRARQAAFTLINCLHGLCSAAGTVTDEAEDQLREFDGSDEEFRQMPSTASPDEEFARSVRMHMTYKAPANSERTPHKHAPWRFRSSGAMNAV